MGRGGLGTSTPPPVGVPPLELGAGRSQATDAFLEDVALRLQQAGTPAPPVGGAPGTKLVGDHTTQGEPAAEQAHEAKALGISRCRSVPGWQRFKAACVPFSLSCLRGLSQVVFLDRVGPAVFIIAAAFVSSPYRAVCGIAGLITSTLVGASLEGESEATRSGLYGYNGYLAGTAMSLFQAGWRGQEWNP